MKSMASSDVVQPLLRRQDTTPSPTSYFPVQVLPHKFNQSVGDFIGRRLPSWHTFNINRGRNEHDVVSRWRRKTRAFLSSRWGHYLVLLLVSVDVACIFADFMIELRTCELKQKHQRIDRGWTTAQEALDVVSLMFSCLFMLELIAATLSFGLRLAYLLLLASTILYLVIVFILSIYLSNSAKATSLPNSTSSTPSSSSSRSSLTSRFAASPRSWDPSSSSSGYGASSRLSKSLAPRVPMPWRNMKIRSTIFEGKIRS
jgi:hypothetical protein